ncbi:19629_t:CDS:2 [Cetraspora pellucida]|uniref:19629_t:CDS:1 n=1 Tax=Cetraspora pellucida TaxID=1433469 RepID=A0A9N9DX09_9GLOM|nr:19629_t:CDS:2 [Cetraspora pellucida]
MYRRDFNIIIFNNKFFIFKKILHAKICELIVGEMNFSKA